VIAADYAPDGKALAVSRLVDGKVQVEYPLGKAIYTTNGYADYVKVSPSGQEVAFAEHPVYDDDRGWVALVDEKGNHRQLTNDYAPVQGLAWKRDGKEIWYTASNRTTDRKLFGVDLSGKAREILTTPFGIRILDIGPEGKALVSSEDQRSEIVGIDPETKKERKGLEWFNGSRAIDVSRDGKALVYSEWSGPAGDLYLVVYRKLDGSAPTALGEGAFQSLSPDSKTVAAVLFSTPPQVVLHPVGPGENRKLGLGELTSVSLLNWFPDGKHLLVDGSAGGRRRGRMRWMWREGNRRRWGRRILRGSRWRRMGSGLWEEARREKWRYSIRRGKRRKWYRGSRRRTGSTSGPRTGRRC